MENEENVFKDEGEGEFYGIPDPEKLAPFLEWANVNPATSDPVEDMKKMFNKIRYERWICKGCAWYTNAPPNANITFAILTCPECGGTDFHYTYEPYE